MRRVWPLVANQNGNVQMIMQSIVGFDHRSCHVRSKTDRRIPSWFRVRASTAAFAAAPVRAVRARARSGISRNQLRNDPLDDDRRRNLRLELDGLIDL